MYINLQFYPHYSTIIKNYKTLRYKILVFKKYYYYHTSGIDLAGTKQTTHEQIWIKRNSLKRKIEENYLLGSLFPSFSTLVRGIVKIEFSIYLAHKKVSLFEYSHRNSSIPLLINIMRNICQSICSLHSINFISSKMICIFFLSHSK